MGGFKLAHSLASSVPPHDPWTTLILDAFGDGDGGGRLRLDYGTGRTSSAGPKCALAVTVQVREVDDRRLLSVDGMVLDAEELGRRFVGVARTVFEQYENSKPRKTKAGRKTKKPKKMWFRLVASDSRGDRLDDASLELTRDDDERVVGQFDDDGDLTADETLRMSEGSEFFARFLAKIMRRDDVREGTLMAVIGQSQEQVRLAIEQTRAMAETVRSYETMNTSIAQVQQNFVERTVTLMSEVSDQRAEAVVATNQAEMQARLASETEASFWDTAAGEMISAQAVEAASAVLRAAQNPAAVSKVEDFLARVAAKTISYTSKFGEGGGGAGGAAG